MKKDWTNSNKIYQKRKKAGGKREMIHTELDFKGNRFKSDVKIDKSD